jgi:hypothetical protein
MVIQLLKKSLKVFPECNEIGRQPNMHLTLKCKIDLQKKRRDFEVLYSLDGLFLISFREPRKSFIVCNVTLFIISSKRKCYPYLTCGLLLLFYTM